MEYWKELARYSGYEISSIGRVRSSKRSPTKFLKIATNNVGYNLVCLSQNGIKETGYIHRLVAETFIPTGLDKKLAEVNHKDKNRKNNQIENLEWTNYADNQKHKLDPVRYLLHQKLNALTEMMTIDQLETFISYGYSNK